MISLKPIKNEQDYLAALIRLEQIFDAKLNSAAGDELEILAILIDKYEEEVDPIDFPDPIEAIKFSMEQKGIRQKDLVEIIGYKTRVSEILSKKRKLTLAMIRKLHEKLRIPTDVLVREY